MTIWADSKLGTTDWTNGSSSNIQWLVSGSTSLLQWMIENNFAEVDWSTFGNAEFLQWTAENELLNLLLTYGILDEGMDILLTEDGLPLFLESYNPSSVWVS